MHSGLCFQSQNVSGEAEEVLAAARQTDSEADIVHMIVQETSLLVNGRVLYCCVYRAVKECHKFNDILL